MRYIDVLFGIFFAALGAYSIEIHDYTLTFILSCMILFSLSQYVVECNEHYIDKKFEELKNK